VEASLLPAKSIRALCDKVTVAAVQISHAKALRREFDIHWLNCQIVILNGEGETLDSFIADGAGHGCTKDSKDKFPDLLEKAIQNGLLRRESIQSFLRTWQSDPTTTRFDAVVSRLQCCGMYKTLKETCDSAAKDKSLPSELRQKAEIQAFLAQSRSIGRLKGCEFLNAGEALLTKYPNHPLAGSVTSTMFYRGIANAFDVSAKTEACVDRLRTATVNGASKLALAKHIETMKSQCKQVIDRLKQVEKELENRKLPHAHAMWIRIFRAAQLGDAKTLIELLPKSPYKKHCAEWLREAKEKLRTKH
jgi:hypothetical protein